MLGIIGGTFDPIHYGHLRSALEVQQALSLTQIHFVPLATAVHRHQPVASATQRLAMLKAAIAGLPGLVVDEREIQRSGPSYTIDTLIDWRCEDQHTSLCLIVGNDAFHNFLTWHRPMEILQLAHLVVMQRPGANISDHSAIMCLLKERLCSDHQQLRSCKAGRILLQPVTQLDISSSAIRAKLAVNEDIRFLLPDAVLNIIQREAIYSKDKIK